MADNPTRAKNRFAQTRRDHATELDEDYVEAISEIIERHGECRVNQLAEEFSVTHVTVSRILSRLQKGGLVKKKPYGPVCLTERGATLARYSQQRHDTVLQFLLALGVSHTNAEIDAEGIEHHVCDETLSKMKRFIKSKS